MSDADDRMERADRIREMRQAREPDADGGEPDDGRADAADGDGSANGAGERDSEREVADRERDGADADSAERDRTDAAADRTVDRAGATDAATTDDVSSTEPSTAPSSGLAPLGGTSGFSLSGEAEMDAGAGEDGADDGDESDSPSRGRAGSTATTTTAESSVRVLEFTVGEQGYCIDIERVEEIVKREAVTRVPNTAAYVEGVVDLRGQITTVLDTKQLLDVAETGREGLLVVFAPDAFEEHGSVGWVVDEVRQVVPVADSQVRRPPGDEEYVRGVVDRDDDDELILWIRPGDAMSRAVALVGDDGAN